MTNCARFVASLTVVLLGISAASAQTTLFWDGDGTGTVGGGVGTWNTSGLNWSTTSGGSTYQAWNNANNDSAEFGGTAGAVTVGANVTVNSLTFDVGGYSL